MEPQRAHPLDLRVPPVVVVMGVAMLMFLAARLVPGLSFPVPTVARGAGVFVLATLGASVIAAGIHAFHRAKTTVNPTRPDTSSTVVDTGIYARTRNPMYVGMHLILLAWAFWLMNGAAAIVESIFVLYINRFQIQPEERTLMAHFGERYGRYVSRVPRWWAWRRPA